MQVKSKKLPPVFQPIELTITIQSEDELQALRAITSYDCSIPEVIVEDWGGTVSKDAAGALLRAIRKSI